MGKPFTFPERVHMIGDDRRLFVNREITDIVDSNEEEKVLSPVFVNPPAILALFPLSAFLEWYERSSDKAKAATRDRMYAQIKTNRIRIPEGIFGFEPGSRIRTLPSERHDFVLLVPESIYQRHPEDATQRVYGLMRELKIA
jgi:hypothetical protein